MSDGHVDWSVIGKALARLLGFGAAAAVPAIILAFAYDWITTNIDTAPFGHKAYNVCSAVGAATLIALIIVSYIADFATSVYPAIPATLGGGRPTRIKLVMKNQKSEVVRFEKGRRTITYGLLLENESTLVIINQGKAVEIPRDVIDAVIVDESETP